MIDDKRLSEICQEVASEFQMGGLAGTVYEEFAIEVAKRAIKEVTEAPCFTPKVITSTDVPKGEIWILSKEKVVIKNIS